MRRVLAGFLVACALLALAFAPQGAAAQQRELRIFNWSDYIAPAVLEAFERETGIKVVYDTFDQMDLVETRVMAGRTGYDLIVVTASFLPRHIPLNLYQPIDRSRLQNARHLWPEIDRRMQRYDPGNRVALNYMWGTTGIGYNVARIREILGPDARIDSWRFFFDPAILQRLASCGVHVLDATEEMFPAALNFLGLNPDSKQERDLNRAADLLQRLRPHIRRFHSSEYINALATGEICFAIGYSGDILQARKRAKEANNGVEIAYSVPREGALMWFDNFVIPRDAANVEAAYLFMDFVNRPEMAARNSNFIQYANSNLASQALLDPAVLNDPGIYPSAETMGRLYTITPFDERTQRLVNRLWTRVKTGR
jgi:putrescine transport system substrate-binding protein